MICLTCNKEFEPGLMGVQIHDLEHGHYPNIFEKKQIDQSYQQELQLWMGAEGYGNLMETFKKSFNT